MTEHRLSLDERLRNHPHLLERFESILSIVEDSAGNIELADEAERLAIIEVRKLGSAMLHEWANKKESQKSSELVAAERKATRNVKKTPLEHDIRHNKR